MILTTYVKSRKNNLPSIFLKMKSCHSFDMGGKKYCNHYWLLWYLVHLIISFLPNFTYPSTQSLTLWSVSLWISFAAGWRTTSGAANRVCTWNKGKSSINAVLKAAKLSKTNYRKIFFLGNCSKSWRNVSDSN